MEEKNQNKCVLTCPQDWEENKGHCYLWSKTRKNWNDAEQICIKRGGHLASITNLDIHDYIWNKIQSANESSVWVGGTDKEKEGIWKWSDGGEWDFTKWAAEPNNFNRQHCLVILKNRPSSTAVDGWHDTWCDHDHKFVCSCPICRNKDTTINTNNDNEFMTIGFYIFIGMLCFLAILGLAGLTHMIRNNCRCQVQCCANCKDLEKRDVNVDYGTYYSDSGERRENIVEVSVLPSHNSITILFQSRQATRILSTVATTTWRQVCEQGSRTTTLIMV